MAHNAYLSITAERQGLISRGCNTKDSVGGKYQEGHINEISVLATEHTMMKFSGQNRKNHNPITITKFIDKSTPLLNTAFARQEYLDCTLKFYRTNEQGYNENHYTVELKKALITHIALSKPHSIQAHDEEMTEQVSLSYQTIVWKHNIAGTEGYDDWETTYEQS